MTADEYRTGKRDVPESEVQRDTLKALQLHPKVAFVFRLNTASGFLVAAGDWDDLKKGRKLIGEVLARFIRFAFPGCSDILGMLKGGRFLAVECKRANGRLSDEQGDFLAMVNRNGGLGFISRGIDDVQRHLAEI